MNCCWCQFKCSKGRQANLFWKGSMTYFLSDLNFWHISILEKDQIRDKLQACKNQLGSHKIYWPTQTQHILCMHHYSEYRCSVPTQYCYQFWQLSPSETFRQMVVWPIFLTALNNSRMEMQKCCHVDHGILHHQLSEYVVNIPHIHCHRASQRAPQKPLVMPLHIHTLQNTGLDQ